MKKHIVLVILFTLSAVCLADITTGLRVYCPMDESAGYAIENKAGFGDATVRRVDWTGTWQDDPVVSNPAWEPSGGKFYGCLNGHSTANSGQPIWCQLTDPINVGYSVPTTTTAFWFKMETADNSAYAFNANGVWGTRALFTEFNGDDYIYACAVSGSNKEKYGPGWKSSLRGAWHHYAFVTDIDNAVPEDRLKIYIDGVQVGAGVTFPLPGWPINISMLAFCGTPNDWGAGSEMRMDEFRFYHRALSASDMTELYNYTPPAPGPGRAVVNGPINGGNGSIGWRLSWIDGVSGPFDSYDVYMGRDFDAVNTATTAQQCTPGSSNLVGDVDNDCVVDEYDLLAMANCWLSDASCNQRADIYDSSTIDFNDFSVLAGNWLVSKPFIQNTTAKEYWLTNSNLSKTGQIYYWRIDEHKGSSTIKGAVWNFDAVAKWKQTKFVNMMGWSETMQVTDKTGYAQSLYNLGIRNTMDTPESIQYTYPKGMETFIYKNPTGAEYAIAALDNPAVCGYFQFDEPSTSLFATTVKTYHWACRDVDQSRPSYTNLLSTDGTGIGSYTSYLDSFINAVKPEVLSFDCYPYRYGFEDHWASLEIARQKALAAGIPLWNWQQTLQRNSRPWPLSDVDPPSNEVNRNRLRYVTYSSLAYGVKGFSWFDITRVYTFGTQGYGSRTWATTSWWSDLATVNAEINRVGTAMVPLTSNAVYHTNSTSNTTLLPGDFWIQIVNSDSGFVLGTFKDASNIDYAFVSNKSDSSTVSNKNVTFQTTVSAVSVFNEQTGNWDALTVNGSPGSQYVQITMGPGYGKLLRILKP